MAPPSKDQFIRQSHPACHDKQLCIDTHQMVEAVWKHAPTDKRGKVELHQFNTRMARELQTTFGNGWHIVTGLHFAVQIRYRKGRCLIFTHRSNGVKIIIFRIAPVMTRTTPVISEPRRQQSFSEPKRIHIHFASESMTKKLQESIVNEIQYTLETSSEIEQLANELKQYLNQLGSSWNWQVVTSLSKHSLCYDAEGPRGNRRRQLLDVTVGKHHLICFHDSGNEDDMRLDLLSLGKKCCIVLSLALLLVFLTLRSQCSTACLEKDACPETSSSSSSMHLDAVRCEKWKFLSLMALLAVMMCSAGLKLVQRIEQKKQQKYL